ncbi:MAG: prepilin-type N-terminal cleavage/methylation domain-containing protein [Candidatus Ozemobacteraceae bacterium]
MIISNPRRDGLTLLEVLIAFLILVISVLAVSGLISHGHRGTQKDFRMVSALHLLSAHMNYILTIPYASLSSRITAEPTLFSNDNASGASLWGAPYGLASSTKWGVYNVDYNLRHQALTFGLIPIDIPGSTNYVVNVATSFVFGAPMTAVYDGTDVTTKPWNVIKIRTIVKWTETNGLPRKIEAVSFLANLEGS